MNSILLHVHGIGIEIGSDDEAFLDFVRSYYACFLPADPPTAHLRVTFSESAGNKARRQAKEWRRLGERLHVGEHGIYWENEFGFAVRVLLEQPDRWDIIGYHNNLLQQQSDEDRRKNYTRSMRWMIHFPLFCLLEQFRGLRLVHASAISRNGRALVLAGLNKVGKSSLARYLHEKHDYRYVSDNFLLTDGARLYAFPERARLPETLFDHLGQSAEAYEVVYGKRHIPMPRDQVEMESVPETVFLVGNEAQTSITPCERHAALHLLDSTHRYLQEFPEYSFYAFLDTINGWKSTTRHPYFDESIPFYRLNLALDWDLSKVAEQIMACISTI